MQLTKRQIRALDCSNSKVLIVRADQVEYVKLNPTAKHLTVEFLLPGYLDSGDMHILTEPGEETLKHVAKVIADAGGDFSRAIHLSFATKPSQTQ
jgi:hypothetical protein